jgi:pimeloyl-ACP methyl ester carboxylesterase
LLGTLPVLIAWGSDDRTIPPHHHRAIGGRELADPRFVEVAGAGHHPHETHPAAHLSAIHQFLRSTAPFRYAETRWRTLLTTPAQAAPS